jgi:hypothetical protein
MKRPILVLIMLMNLFVLGSIYSCSDDKNNVITPPSIDDVDETALLDTLEARNAAMWISGDLTASEELAMQILNDLKQIRYDYSDVLPVHYLMKLPLRFFLPWKNSIIYLLISSETYERYQRGEWHDIEILNEMYELSGITSLTSGTGYHYLTLRFEGEKNPIVLSDAYSQLDDVLDVKIQSYDPYSTGGGLGLKKSQPFLWPWHVDNDVTYFYIKPCASPLPYITCAEYWYFRSIEDEGIILVGYWHRHEGGPWPEWWQEANRVLEEFENILEYM